MTSWNFGRLLHRKIGGPLSFENSNDVFGLLTTGVGAAGSIGH
jgi:hypothetical protein